MTIRDQVEDAVRCVLLLAAVEPGARIPAVRLAHLLDDSAADLVGQLRALARAGLVHRGADNTVVLARPAHDISVADVVEAVAGPIALVSCGDVKCRGPLTTPDPLAPGRCGAPAAAGLPAQSGGACLATQTIATMVDVHKSVAHR